MQMGAAVGIALATAQQTEMVPDGYGWALLKMLLVLVIVCVIAYVTLRFGRYAVETNADGAAIAVLRYLTHPDRLTPTFLRDIVVGMAHDVEQLLCELAKGQRMYPWRATPPS